MSECLTEEEKNRLQASLEQIQQQLMEDVREELRRSGREDLAGVVDGAHDRGEEALADVMADTDLLMVKRHMQGIADVKAAMSRIRNGGYGVCSDCGVEIGYQRLMAYPSTKRCVNCQEAVEGEVASSL